MILMGRATRMAARRAAETVLWAARRTLASAVKKSTMIRTVVGSEILARVVVAAVARVVMEGSHRASPAGCIMCTSQFQLAFFPLMANRAVV